MRAARFVYPILSNSFPRTKLLEIAAYMYTPCSMCCSGRQVVRSIVAPSDNGKLKAPVTGHHLVNASPPLEQLPLQVQAREGHEGLLRVY